MTGIIGALTGLPIGTGQPATNAQSAVQQYDPTKAFAGFPRNQTQNNFDTSALLDLAQLQEGQAASPGDQPAGANKPTMMAGGGGGMSDGGFG